MGHACRLLLPHGAPLIRWAGLGTWTESRPVKQARHWPFDPRRRMHETGDARAELPQIIGEPNEHVAGAPVEGTGSSRHAKSYGHRRSGRGEWPSRLLLSGGVALLHGIECWLVDQALALHETGNEPACFVQSAAFAQIGRASCRERV